ncbi:DNA polymerase I [Myxococcota bacterium]|nr:DNA polymerase I [Myxococcota bacterium]
MSPSPKSTAAAARLVFVDGTNALYRAFFAIPNLRAPDGTPTNAAYGFVNMLGKVLREEEPSGVVVVFDARGKTFRHELFDGYKAGRDAQPEDLSSQFPLVRELIRAHDLPVLEVEGVEADDVIATLVARAPAEAEVRIISTDKDLMQLVTDRVELLDGIKDRRYGPADVEARFGVGPDQLLDLRALVGDPSDNIPGVKGIGQKGAAKLIGEWETLENLLDHVEEVTPKRAQTALREHAEDARLSKQLSTLRKDVELPLDPDGLTRGEPDLDTLRELYTRLGFTRLLENLGEPDAPTSHASPSAEVEGVPDVKALGDLAQRLSTRSIVTLFPVIRGVGTLEVEPVGLAFALDDDSAAFLRFSDSGGEGPSLAEVAGSLDDLIGSVGRVGWGGLETKRLQLLFAEQGLELAAPSFDVGVAGQMLDSSGAQSLSALASRYLGEMLPSFEDLAGRGKKALPTGEIPPADLAQWAGQQVRAVDRLRPILESELDAAQLTPLYESVEVPLTRVLAGMERNGVRVDEAALAGLSQTYGAELERIEARIHELAGETFLVSSPKQLQRILFEKLKLPVIKKTKTGYSTDEGVLEQLSAEHDLPGEVLAYRRLAKLKSTYLDALPRLVNSETGRIHPIFHQLGAATGRLSSANPNVQNIPIRTEEGARIREAFVPADGMQLLSADYSQVELRILAHYSQDESLIEAFRAGDDIHQRTAAEVEGIRAEDVDGDLRARAKAVNFGIIYGSSAFGLARQLGIAGAEAQAMIDAYFERYRGVRRFLDETVEQAREQGYVQTLFDRRRYLPDLASRNRVLRNAAERMAVNTVIQGTAADLIKKVMLTVDAALAGAGLAARMILQVHDELVFEVAPGDVESLESLVRREMEGVEGLQVPLVVDVGVGENWNQAH